MVVKRSADILECILHLEETDERNLYDSEQTVEAEHKAEGDCKQNVARFEDADAKEKSECS